MADEDQQSVVQLLRSLTRKRGSVKQRLTNFEKFVNDQVLASQQPNFSVSSEMTIELEQRIQTITEALSEFAEIQLQLETVAPDDEIQAHYNYREEFEDKYFVISAKAKGLLMTFKTKMGVHNLLQPRVSSEDGNSVLDEQDNRSVHSTSSSFDYTGGIKLPTIEIPTFGGKYDSWLEFRDTFNSLIHEHKGLKNIHKFHYLRSSLKGEASQVIKALDFSENNYEKAWDLVCKRYNNTRLLINNHIKALFELEKLAVESSLKLRSFVDTIDKHLCALESLEQPTDKWDILIVHMASLKLDGETNRKWEEQQTGTTPPTLEEFKEFLNKRADFLESLELKNKVKDRAHAHVELKTKRNSSRSLVSANQNCPLCQSEHTLFNCSEFQAIPIGDRTEKVKSLRLCFNCLKPGHFLGKCGSKSQCKHCNRKHNSLLHDTTCVSKPSEENAKTDVALWSQSRSQTTLLGTVCIVAFDKYQKPHSIRAVLDCGSQSSYVTARILHLLELDSHPIDLQVTGLGMSCSNVTEKCTLKIRSQHNAFAKVITCLVIPNITGSLPEITFDNSALNIPKHLRLADPSFNQSNEIDLLLGADYFWEVLCAAQIKLGKNKPILQKTVFGWVVTGPLNTNVQQSNCSKSVCNLSCQVSNKLDRFWEIEEDLSCKESLSLDELECEKHFKETISRDPAGRFVVTIPFKQDISLLGESKDRATRLLYSLERRFENNCLLKDRYIDFMEEYENLGHMTKVTTCADTETAYYMPHHGVVREESESTKLRVVFNGSSPTTTGYSLNDLQSVGPTIQPDLFSILVRFREHTYVVSADITKMYRQVLVKEEQRPLQRILWRSNPSEPVSVFNLNTVTYGTSSAPFLAIRCLFELADQFQSTHPSTSEVIKRDFYVDDMLTGANSMEILKQTCNEVDAILQSGGFELRKWISNNETILESIDRTKWSRSNMSFVEEADTKMLGVGWSAKSDCLIYKINVNDLSKQISKRSILSDIARIFDPLGLLAPCIVVAKILMQQLWQLNVSWDEAIPLDLYTRWKCFKSNLHIVNDLQIPRHAISANATKIELHGFADACERAYGACIYLRSFNNDNTITVKLLCAKSKVSPLKTLTIPRLELCAALILARLFKKICDSLLSHISKCTFWSDSTIVLCWIKTSPSSLKSFVSNRVAEIQTLTRNHDWRHVSTQDNPADLVSRGVNPADLLHCQLWWSGPSWLSEHTLPQSEVFETEEVPEIKVERRCLHVTEISNSFAVPFCNFSKLSKLERIVAYCLRFKQHKPNRTVGFLQGSEIQNARITLIKVVQKSTFFSELCELEKGNTLPSKSKLTTLSPFIHSDGTLRVGGRLSNSHYSFDKIHPIILPSSHDFTKLLFHQSHLELLHGGAQLLLSTVRERYWPIGGRNLAKQVVRNCLICRKANPKPCSSQMGNLPTSRIVPSPPFFKVGVDYAGPIMTVSKRGRGARLVKSYICIFICFCTKAVHLEAVSDLSTDAFVISFRRFVARRGKPLEVYSDNGTNFVGANNELKELGKLLIDEADSLSQNLNSTGVNWKFIPPRSPHFGGLWESGVRSVKHHLRRVAGNSHLTFEELQTLLIQIESVLNSRPLYPLSSEPNDLNPLTPGHFLIGRPLTALPDADLVDTNEARLSRYQRVQQLYQHFWARWRKEYLTELQSRYKWKYPNIGLKVGSLVVLHEENLPPLKWRMGRVCQLHPGQDGQVRVASVKTSTGIVRRAVSKLCLLPDPDQQSEL